MIAGRTESRARWLGDVLELASGRLSGSILVLACVPQAEAELWVLIRRNGNFLEGPFRREVFGAQ